MMQAVSPRPARAHAVDDPLPAGHMPALDGVRGVAVLLVMWLHFTMFSGVAPTGLIDRLYVRTALSGWIGVDLFFVLSGFLITGILFDAKGRAFYFRNFYARRALRIFPLYYGFLALPLLILPLLFSSSAALEQVGSTQGWYWSYLANVLFARDGWPEPLPGGFPMGHLWSLAVEEQFYLLWPLLVFSLSRTRLLWACGWCIALSLVVRVGLVLADNATAAYVLTPARMDSLALGGLVALLARGATGMQLLRRHASRSAACCAALLLVIVAWRGRLDAEDVVVQTIGYPLIGALFAAILALTLTAPPAGGWSSLFNQPVLRFFGRYSYALYIFHTPVVFVLRRAGVSAAQLTVPGSSVIPGQLAFFALATACSVLLAFVSWHACEAPVMKLKRFFPYGPADPATPRTHVPEPLPAPEPLNAVPRAVLHMDQRGPR